MNTTPDTELLRLSEAARRCHVDKRTLRKWIKQGLTPGFQSPSGLFYVPVAWVEAYIHQAPLTPKETPHA